MALSRFQNDSLTVFDSFNNHLRQGNICELKLALILLLFEANIENINRSAKWANADFRTIALPSNRCDRVIIFDLLAADLIPLRSLGIEVVNVEAVKISNHCSLASSIESSTCELLNSFILWVVKSLEAVSSLLVEVDLSIVATS